MILIADGGSTKTEWCLCNNGLLVKRFFTSGINPYILTDERISTILISDVLSQIDDGIVTEIHFYGAGCRDVVIPRMTSVFSAVFTSANGKINIYSDMLASARALFGKESGIACILGTGSNSCYYDGKNIADGIPPLGYVLGDEGSGSDIGKHIINAVFKRRLPDHLINDFIKETQLTQDDIIRKTYKEAEPGKFLASFSHFAADHIEDKEIKDIVVTCFTRFFKNNIDAYNISECKIGAIGSIAYHFNQLLQTTAKECGYDIVKILKSPMSGLLCYHEIKE